MKAKKLIEADEIQRIESNLQKIKQIRYKAESLVFALNKSSEYYLNLLPSLIEKKTRCLSFYYDYSNHFRSDPSGLINISDNTRKIHNDLKIAFKETAEYLSELHDLAKSKSEQACVEFKETKPTFDSKIFKTELGSKIFHEWLSEYKDTKYVLADISFIYRKLADKYLQPWQKPEVFRKNTLPSFEINLPDKIKLERECTTARKIKDFDRILNSLK